MYLPQINESICLCKMFAHKYSWQFFSIPKTESNLNTYQLEASIHPQVNKETNCGTSTPWNMSITQQ